MRTSLAAVAVSLIVAVPLAAQSERPPLVTDRPDQTESAAVVPRGFAQLELGGLYSVDKPGTDPRVRAFNLGGALLRYGLADPVEFRLGFAGWTEVRQTQVPTTEGMGDINVGFKARLATGEDGGPALALVGIMTVPTGREGFRALGPDPVLKLAVAHDLGNGFGLGYNVGAALTRLESPAGMRTTEGSLLWTVALGRSLFDRLGAFVEGYGTAGLGDGIPSWTALDAGLTFALTPTLQLDTSAGVGLGDAAADWFVSGGLSLRVPR